MAEYFGEAHNLGEAYEEFDYISKKIDEEVGNNTNLISDEVEEDVTWFEKMGIKSIEAKAGEKYAKGTFRTGGGNQSYLKKILIAKKYKSSNHVKVIYEAYWDTMPKNRWRDLSVLGWDSRVYWSAADLNISNPADIVVRHYWTPVKKVYKYPYLPVIDYYIVEKEMTRNIVCAGYDKNSSMPYNANTAKYFSLISGKETTYETEQYIIGDSAMFVCISLHNDTRDYFYKNEGIIMGFNLRIDSQDSPGPTFYTNYYHTWLTTERDNNEALSGIIQMALTSKFLGYTLGASKVYNGLTGYSTLKSNESGLGLYPTFIYDYKYK